MKQRRARKPARLRLLLVLQRGGPRQRCVGNDQTRQPGPLPAHHAADVCNRLGIKVRRHFQEDRLAFPVRCAATRQQCCQRSLVLQAAQARRVRRGDVDRDIVRMRRHRLDADDIVLRAVFRILVGADIRADRHAGRTFREPADEILEPVIVEAHPVDHRAVFLEPEQARLRIARLRLRRHGAAFDKAETEPRHRVRHFAILVKPGGEPHG